MVGKADIEFLLFLNSSNEILLKDSVIRYSEDSWIPAVVRQLRQGLLQLHHELRLRSRFGYR